MSDAKIVTIIDLQDGATLPLRRDEGDATSPMSVATELCRDEFRALADAAISSNSYIKEMLTGLAESIRPLLPTLADLVPEEFTKNEKLMDHNLQILRDAGYSEDELDCIEWALLINMAWVAQQLQGVAGFCPVGENLTKQIRDGAPRNRSVRGQSVKVTALLSNLGEGTVRGIIEGSSTVTVADAVQLAIAYGITPAELLGFMDSDEVRLLRLWRGMDAEKRHALLTLLEPPA